MGVEDRLNAKVQYYTLKLLLVIARRLLDTDKTTTYDKYDLNVWSDVNAFIKFFFDDEGEEEK